MTGPLVSSPSSDILSGAVAQPHPQAPAATKPFPATRRHAGTTPFSHFGRWGDTIRVVRAGAENVLVRWMALHRHQATSYESLWERCQEALPYCFLEYRIVHMRRPSFFLPAGEVVFKVLTNPTQIPDSPPLGVWLRHSEALDAFPMATYHYLRPVFTADPYPRLYTAEDLRREAQTDCQNIVEAARIHGWAIRARARAHRAAVWAARLGLRAATRAMDALYLLTVPIERRILARMANRSEQLRSRDDLPGLAQRADELGLVREAQEFRRAALRLQSTFDFDPILCFEVPSRPGQLWFEAHWYRGQDGRTYVHY